ncbi:MAG: carbon storage regulator CsrA [Thermodesulfovibrio sp.]|nr:carbon storage regulator CsrA [Thermodesulfovibrio sp.]MDW7999017.1 carbon storage regulator CsrA [Thermodesulfovibrio sp.]
MLVLTRKTGQSIRIGEEIIIKIIDIDGSQVKIGIEAPKGILIFREELYEKLKESNIEALKTAKELKIDDLIKQTENPSSLSDSHTTKDFHKKESLE